MGTLPSGTLTFLFTDIEGSTQLWEKHPDAMRGALAQHDALIKRAVETNHGHIIKSTGDGVHAVFPTALDAIHGAMEGQRELQRLISELQLKARMGLHTGEAELRAGDYFGQSLNRAARIMSVGHGGQILLSAVTAELVREHLPTATSLLEMGEHRLKDLIRAEQIFQLCAPDLPTDFPPLRTLNTLPNNLPLPLTSFIGREREMDEAKKLLASSRLVTLIGPGGTGKTRLSLQVAADVLPSFREGAWMVELAPLADPSLIVQSIAAVFGLREQPGMPLVGLVLDYLRAKQLLLILDNCEHLVEDCAKLAEQFLQTGPHLKIIASSREALGISGETVYRVPSLDLPDDTSRTRRSVLDFESVQLFLERAAAADSKFQLTDENASAVAQICRRLDGIPLALELAAARVKVFSPEQIAARLDDRFRLLTGGSRTALPRQQTLRALIDWSYDILSDDERALLRQLSVFAGGWTYEAAESICGDLNVLDLLTQLINKSLIVVEDGRETRYRLLETIRQYARDKLLESGSAETVRNEHLRYFVKLTETAEPGLEGFEYRTWAARLNAEYDNIRTALEWGLANDLEAALRLVGALPFFWMTQGYSAEGYRWASAVLDKEASQMRQYDDMTDGQLLVRAKAYLTQSRLATDLGDDEATCSTAAKSVELARKTAEKGVLAYALASLASGKANLGAVDEAYALAQESLKLARENGDSFALGFSLVMMGQLRAMILRNDYEGALEYAQEAIAIAEAGGNRWGSSMTTFGLGFFARSIGDYDQARSRFMACLPTFIELGDKHRISMIRSELAHIEREQGQYEKAVPMYRETILEWQRLGHRAAIAHQLECFAFIAKAQEDGQRAARLLGAAEALREWINIPMTQLERGAYEHEIADLRGNMEEAEFSAAWTEGRAMTMEQAIQLALSE